LPTPVAALAMMQRRRFLQACSCAASVLAAEATAHAGTSSAAPADASTSPGATGRPAGHTSWLANLPRERHEAAMREAMVMGRRNPRYPFGAVITDRASGEVLARGVN